MTPHRPTLPVRPRYHGVAPVVCAAPLEPAPLAGPPRAARRTLGRCGAALALAALLVPVATPPAPAWADETTERATAKAIKAQALFKSGQFLKAAEAFLEAYAIAAKATMLFNAARAYEEAAALDEAIALYQRYLTLRDADAAGRADASKRLAALSKRRAEGAGAVEVAEQPAGHVVPSPLPTGSTPPKSSSPVKTPSGPTAGPAAADRGIAASPKPDAAEAAEARAAEAAALRDVDAEVSGPLWFLLGCAVVGLPLAYLSEPAPPPSRMLGKSDAWVLRYASTFRRVAAARHKDMAVYGCLTGAAATLLLGSLAN